MTQPPPFDVDAFLAQPLTARVAASGPTVRPTWYLWEDGAFWILTGPWATLPARVQTDPAIAIVVDVCDLATGLVQQVIARGRAEILPFDVARGRRKLSRYLGQDETRWDRRFRHYLHDDPAHTGTVWLRLRPDSLVVQDLSYSVCNAPTMDAPSAGGRDAERLSGHCWIGCDRVRAARRLA